MLTLSIFVCVLHLTKKSSLKRSFCPRRRRHSTIQDEACKESAVRESVGERASIREKEWVGGGAYNRKAFEPSNQTQMKSSSCKREKKKKRERENENKAIIALVPHSTAVAALSAGAAAAVQQQQQRCES